MDDYGDDPLSSAPIPATGFGSTTAYAVRPHHQPPADPPTKLLDGLTPAQAQAAIATGPVLALAGAGTGKTKTLTSSVAIRIDAGLSPARAMAVTFTNKTARQLETRLGTLLSTYQIPSWVGTFHAIAARMLRIEPEMAGLRSDFTVLDADDARRILRRVMTELNVSTKKEGGTDPLKAIARIIERLKDQLIAPHEAPSAIEAMIEAANREQRRVDAVMLRTAAMVYPAYQRELREGNATDYGDLLLWPTRAMRDDEQCRQRFAGRFDGIWVDEYQDVNFAQYLFLQLLARDHRNLFAVGDDDQSIFGFRGSDIAYIRRFREDYPDCTEVRLEQNFRSTGHILDAANAVIAHDAGRLGKTLYTDAGPGLPIQIVSCDGPDEEAHGIVADIRRRNAAGTKWGEIAVLYRSNYLSRSIEDQLIRNRIPYVLIGDVGFYQRQEIKDALALLKLATDPDDPSSDESCRRMLNTPSRGLGPAAEDAIAQQARRDHTSLLRACENPPLKPAQRRTAAAFADMIRRSAAHPGETLSDQIHRVLTVTGYLAHWRASRADDAEARVENLLELVSLAGTFPSVAALFEHAALASARATDEDAPDRVMLMSIHRAKGLEFVHVYLPGWEDGTLPSARSCAEGNESEERRLAYVALTRAMRRATITHCRFRHRPCDPSPYLADIPRRSMHPGWLDHLR